MERQLFNVATLFFTLYNHCSLREENLRAPIIDPMHDVTQEIDVDEALGYDTDEAVKNIDWPNEQPLQEPVEMQPPGSVQQSRLPSQFVFQC